AIVEAGRLVELVAQLDKPAPVVLLRTPIKPRAGVAEIAPERDLRWTAVGTVWRAMYQRRQLRDVEGHARVFEQICDVDRPDGRPYSKQAILEDDRPDVTLAPERSVTYRRRALVLSCSARHQANDRSRGGGRAPVTDCRRQHRILRGGERRRD